jgi:hypothetical protein
MKRVLIVLTALLCLSLLWGCEKEAQTPNTNPPSLVYGGELYRSTGREIAAEIDESAVVGWISSVVKGDQLPEEEGQANFPAQDAPYARCEEGLAVLIENEWVYFEGVN